MFDSFDDEEEEQTISFKQGTITDCSELVTRTVLVTDFIDLLLNQIDILTMHSYIIKSQAQYLKKIKDELKDNEVIVLGDFAENYSFIVQNEVQGFHWNISQCTLHPVVVYFK